MANSVIHRLLSLRNHSGFVRYFTNTSWLFAEKILRMVVGLFVGVWVARYLGPERYGLLSYAQSFVGLFTAFATLRLDEIVIRELVKDESKRDEILGTAFWLKVVGAFLVFAALGIANNFTSNDRYTNTLVFIVAGATVFQAFNVVDMYFQAKVMGKYIAYVNALSLFVGSIIKIYLIVSNAPLTFFALAVVFDSMILAIGYVCFYLTNGTLITFLTFRRSIAFSLLKDSWPLTLSGLVIMIYMRIDQVMIKEMLDAEAVGQYAAAVRISEAWYFIPMVICSSLFPAVINAKKVSEELYYKRLQSLYDLMASLSMITALFMTTLSNCLVSFVYGNEYNEAGSVLMIHFWGGVFVALGLVWGKWLISEGKQEVAWYFTLAGALTNVILNYFLIRKMGIIGAALATVITSILTNYLLHGLFPSTKFSFVQQSRAFLTIFNIVRILRQILRSQSP